MTPVNIEPACRRMEHLNPIYREICYAKLIVMQSQFRIPFKTQESGTFYFA